MPKNNDIRKTLKNVSALLAIIGTIGTGIFFTVGFFAHASDLKKTDKTLEVVMFTQKMDKLQYQKRDLWDERLFLKRQIRKHPNNQELKDELEKVEEQIKEVKDTMKSLKG